MSFFDDLQEQESSTLEGEGWTPEAEGETVAGIITAVGKGTSDYGDFTIVQLHLTDSSDEPVDEAEDGSHLRTVPMFGTVLSNWAQSNADKLKPGAMFGVKFLGRKGGGGGKQPYKDFAVLVRPGKSFADELASGDDGLPF